MSRYLCASTCDTRPPNCDTPAPPFLDRHQRRCAALVQASGRRTAVKEAALCVHSHPPGWHDHTSATPRRPDPVPANPRTPRARVLFPISARARGTQIWCLVPNSAKGLRVELREHNKRVTAAAAVADGSRDSGIPLWWTVLLAGVVLTSAVSFLAISLTYNPVESAVLYLVGGWLPWVECAPC